MSCLCMSTGLTFGTISAHYGLEHNIIYQEKYSLLVKKRKNGKLKSPTKKSSKIKNN